VSGDEGHTARREFCSPACRVRAYRARRDRALAIAAAGKLTPKQVVERLAREGHEADAATVKKWLKHLKPKKWG
jgi:hypothetical protein